MPTTLSSLRSVHESDRVPARSNCRAPVSFCFGDTQGVSSPPGDECLAYALTRRPAGGRNDCMARMIRKSNRARATSDAALFLL
jgi:hypothetical protein